MRTLMVLGSGVLALWVAGLGACGGPTNEGQGVKTPDQLLREQEELAYKEELERKNRGEDDVSEYQEEPAVFDEAQATKELKRATLSAESCPGVVNEPDQPYGELSVAITFAPDGSVNEATIPSPFDDTPIGNCVLRAYKAVIVPPFAGEQHIMHWDVELKEPEKKPAGKKK